MYQNLLRQNREHGDRLHVVLAASTIRRMSIASKELEDKYN